MHLKTNITLNVRSFYKYQDKSLTLWILFPRFEWMDASLTGLSSFQKLFWNGVVHIHHNNIIDNDTLIVFTRSYRSSIDRCFHTVPCMYTFYPIWQVRIQVSHVVHTRPSDWLPRSRWTLQQVRKYLTHSFLLYDRNDLNIPLTKRGKWTVLNHPWRACMAGNPWQTFNL